MGRGAGTRGGVVVTRKYATGTTVSVDRSIAELRRTVERYGGDTFGMLHERARTVVAFRLGGNPIRLIVGQPDDDPAECRRRFRVLVLLTKAKLEAIADGLTTSDREFLADLVLPGGSTISEQFETRAIDVSRVVPLLTTEVQP